MKKGWIFLLISGLIGCSLSLFGARKCNQANASTIVTGGQAWTFEETTKSSLKFKMAENTAPYNNDWSLRYKLMSRDVLVIIKGDGEQKMLPDSSIGGTEVICKYSPTDYYMEQWFLNDGTTGALEVGDTIKLDGQLINTANDTILEISHSEFYIRGTTEVFTFNEDSKLIIKNDFMSRFNELFEYDIYEPEDTFTLRDIETTLKNSLGAATSMIQVHAAYNLAVSQASSLVPSEDGMLTFKEKSKNEIRNYVSLDNYFDDEKTLVENIISNCCSEIDLKTTSVEIKALLKQAKSNIDAIDTRADVMEKAVLDKTAGYENYLQSYDQVTLNDLSLGDEVKFNGLKDQRNGEINTNKTEKNLYNSFVPNEDNKSGNVIFNFDYQSDCNTNAGANVHVNLRGIKYYGYKFGIDSDKNALYFSKVAPNGDEFLWGSDAVLTSNSSTYHISLGAIDLIEGNRTWITVKVNGVLLKELITESLDFCVNPRVSLSNNDNQYGNAPGISTISNYYPTDYECKISAIYGGIFEYEAGHSDVTTNLHFTLDTNNIEYDPEKGLRSYSTLPENIKLIRGSDEYNLGNSNIPVIAKYSSSNYQLYLSSLFNENVTAIEDGDKLILSGMFAYFSSTTNSKAAFEIMESVFVYDATANEWVPEVSLSNVKQDTTRKVNSYLTKNFLGNYDLEEQNTITNLATQCKQNILDVTEAAAVKDLYKAFISQINSILTSIGKYKETKASELNSYLADQAAVYYEQDWTELNSIKSEYILKIREATNQTDADSLLSEAKALIDSILTIDEHIEENLKISKQQAIQEIKDLYGSLNINSMREEEIIALNNETFKAIEDIKNAHNEEEVNAVLNAYKTKYKVSEKSIEKPANKKYVTIICVSAAVVGISSIAGISFLIYKKRNRIGGLKDE